MEEQKPVESSQSQSKAPQASSVQTSQKPFSKWFIVLIMGLIILVLGMGGYIFMSRQKQVQVLPNPDQVATATVTPVPVVEDSLGFPVYPGATEGAIMKNPACQEGQDQAMTGCDSTVYSWTTPDDYDTVRGWYEAVNTDGWKCSEGGAGDYGGPRDASSISSCSKGGVDYKINYEADSSQTTIFLTIPN